MDATVAEGLDWGVSERVTELRLKKISIIDFKVQSDLRGERRVGVSRSTLGLGRLQDLSN